tara:strand:- start:3148 stop:3306 length:159 start_codon:yes stop_codon:yes gene_type:complete
VNTGRRPSLREIHRGKFPAADDGNTHGLVLSFSLFQQAREVHEAILRDITAA